MLLSRINDKNKQIFSLFLRHMKPNSLTRYKPLPSAIVKPIWLLNKGWFKPQFYGLEHLEAKRPALYIGNHTLYGFDSPSFVFGLYQHKKIWLRGLADHVHFYVPVWRNSLRKFGAFDGNRKAVTQLMRAREHILIYPGGSREVLKNKGEAYQLMWKERLGFADLAIQYGYDIIPFAAKGGDDAFNIVYDANDFNQSFLGKLARKTGFSRKFLRDGEFFLPIATGYKRIPFLPKPISLQFQFMPRISTTHYARNATENNKWELRQQVEHAIEQGLAELKNQSDHLKKP